MPSLTYRRTLRSAPLVMMNDLSFVYSNFEGVNPTVSAMR
jgi:hypothetical protein